MCRMICSLSLPPSNKGLPVNISTMIHATLHTLFESEAKQGTKSVSKGETEFSKGQTEQARNID